jgi:HD-GYP domain-containing protein (c-di-GMP phosphodiesterase class II)
LHNWELTIIPISLSTKKETLSNEEIKTIETLHSHAVQLLQGLPFWQPAQKIIAQCHERPDGLGYPNKLKKDEICDGAKILAIADEFGSIFHTKAHQQMITRTIMSTILIINKGVNSKFDDYWTDLFNKSIRILHQEQQLLNL